MKVSVSLVLILFSVSAFSQSLDKHHLLLDSRLEASSKSRYAFRRRLLPILPMRRHYM